MLFSVSSRFLPWLDRQGRFSVLKAITLALMLAPGLWTGLQFYAGWLQPKPLTLAIHAMGDWAIRFLVVSLMITPLRRIVDWPKLIVVRRMVGVTACVYALVHFTLYIADQQWNAGLVVQEIVLRFYLTIGFVALLGLCALAATSTDAMIRRLGAPRWSRLHKSVYVLAALGLFHYMIQSKLDISRALWIVGLYLVFMLHRGLQKCNFPTHFASVLGLGVVAACLTAMIEALWYHIRNGADLSRILANNFSFIDGFWFSPDFEWTDLTGAWQVLAVALGLGLIHAFLKIKKARPA